MEFSCGLCKKLGLSWTGIRRKAKTVPPGEHLRVRDWPTAIIHGLNNVMSIWLVGSLLSYVPQKWVRFYNEKKTNTQKFTYSTRVKYSKYLEIRFIFKVKVC